jgi:iron(III) transport system permease protein
MLMTPAFRSIDSSLEEASRVCGASRIGTLARIIVPVLAPVLFVVLLMSLIRGLEAFEIELALGTPIGFQVYSTKIYQLVRGSPPDYVSATVLAVTTLSMMVPLIVLQRWVTTRRNYATVTGAFRANVIQLGKWRWPACALVVLVIIFLTVLPMAFQLAGSLMTLFGYFDLPKVWTLRHWEQALSDITFTRGLRNTLVLGGTTAILAVVAYSFVAYAIVRLRHTWRGTLDTLAWLPFTIPGVILGLGYLWMALQVPVLRPLYGTIWVLILVSWLAAMTLGVQVLKGRMLQLGADLEEAGRVVGGTWFRIFRDIIVPLSLPAMAVVAVMVFAITSRQVSTVILLTTGPSTPLSVLQLGFLYGGELGSAGVVGSVIVGLSLTATLLISVLTTRYGARM